MTIRTRIATQNEDEFLFEVYASSRIEEIASWKWADKENLNFLQIQYQCQKNYYALQYPNLETKIILFENEKIGKLLLADLVDRLVIVDLALLLKYQNIGIGTEVLQRIVERARNSNQNIELSVLRSNERAKRLYERMGFQVINYSELYIKLEWSLR